MHFDGTEGATSFVDVKGHAVSAQGSAQITTATSAFGGSSGHFDNPVGVAYLTIPGSDDWNLRTGDSTVEMWISPTSVGMGGDRVSFLSQSPTTGDGQWTISMLTSRSLAIQDNGGANSLSSLGKIVLGGWQHVAVVRAAGHVLLFISGSQSASAANDFYTATANLLFVGASNTSSFGCNYCWNGYIDELRITKGVARYTSNFTPPTAPFPDCP
jgi:hypothetical protein